MKQIIVAIMLLSFSVAALALSPDVLWTASDTNLLNNAMRTGIPPVVQLELNDSGNMELNWAEITDATGYVVYHANAPEPIGSDAWTVLATLPPVTLSYTVASGQTRGFFYVTSTQDDGPDMPENFIFVEGGTINDNLTVSSFYLDKYQLTQEEYMSIMVENPSNFVGPNHPVHSLSWFDAIEYCNRRSIDEHLTPCYSYSTDGTDPDGWPDGWNTDNANDVNVHCDFSAIGYRLPRESEWEYAARGGLDTHGYTYSGSDDINQVAWYSGNNSPYGTKPVGGKLANELGIFDMSGNVFEWCWDVYWMYGRLARGGSYGHGANHCNVSDRYYSLSPSGDMGIGFRLFRSSP